MSQTDVDRMENQVFDRIKLGLRKTRSRFAEGMANLVFGDKVLDQDLFDEIQTQLILADVGVAATTEIIAELTGQVRRKQLQDADVLYKELQKLLIELLLDCEKPLDIQARPSVILVVGVNGAGKTTTIGKLAAKMKADGLRVMLAAGDTYRAAAVEQLQAWGGRHDVPVIAQPMGSDSAAVIYDALQSATARQMDVLIADTAGRLHNKANLMEELQKIVRVMQKLNPNAPHEVLLVLDATTGQNSLQQAKEFMKAVNVSGLVLTKLDGTAKGGIIFAIARQLQLPIRFVCVGEQVDDLQLFHAEEFVQALFDTSV